MKKIFTVLVAIFLAATIWAQSPYQMSYQAVIRDTDGILLRSASVGIRLSILQGEVLSTVVYSETHTVATNANGLVSLAIGTGTSTDDFATIDWANGPYFIKTETDAMGGTDYTILGTSQLLSVPYALHAKTAANGLTTSQAAAIEENTSKVGLSAEQIADLLTELEALKNRVAVLEGGSTDYNSAASVQENLDNGVSILDLLENVTVDDLYGKTYEGGLIFYVNETDGTGLVAAPSDQANDDLGRAAWGCTGTLIDGADGEAIGTGAQNTLDILAGCSQTGTAAQLCADLVLNEKEDWFLPSKDELKAIYFHLNQNGFGGFAPYPYPYWSSTDSSSSFAWGYHFSDGAASLVSKGGTSRVRAVRAF